MLGYNFKILKIVIIGSMTRTLSIQIQYYYQMSINIKNDSLSTTYYHRVSLIINIIIETNMFINYLYCFNIKTLFILYLGFLNKCCSCFTI